VYNKLVEEIILYKPDFSIKNDITIWTYEMIKTLVEREKD
jgi:hypothetical protein